MVPPCLAEIGWALHVLQIGIKFTNIPPVPTYKDSLSGMETCSKQDWELPRDARLGSKLSQMPNHTTARHEQYPLPYDRRSKRIWSG